jgi:5'-deoxynucleotidase
VGRDGKAVLAPRNVAAVTRTAHASATTLAVPPHPPRYDAPVSHFFAYLARMKFIQRWGLMRNTSTENIQEHSLQVAMIAHALALLHNERLGRRAVDPERTALLAVFHDAEEVITGDVPSPIKYFNPQVRDAVADLGEVAKHKLLEMVPEPLRSMYEPLLFARAEDAEAWRMVKLADKLCAYLKCVEEAKAGNREFERAEASIRRGLDALGDPDLDRFVALYVPSFRLTLDELN